MNCVSESSPHQHTYTARIVISDSQHQLERGELAIWGRSELEVGCLPRAAY